VAPPKGWVWKVVKKLWRGNKRNGGEVHAREMKKQHSSSGCEE